MCSALHTVPYERRMNRDEITALRDVLDLILRLPDDLRGQVAAWLSPAAAKPGNGLDPHPPTVAPTPGAGTDQELLGAVQRSSTKPTPYAGKARRGKSRESISELKSNLPARTAEQRLLTALQEHSGARVAALAKAVASSRSRTGERLRQLAARGVVTKDVGGHWRLAGEEARPTEASPSI
jgi:hypothetical protein